MEGEPQKWQEQINPLQSLGNIRLGTGLNMRVLIGLKMNDYHTMGNVNSQFSTTFLSISNTIEKDPHTDRSCIAYNRAGHHIRRHMCVCVCMYVCVCMCVCVCMGRQHDPNQCTTINI